MLGMNTNASATHMMGADFTYRTIGLLKYEVRLTIYRDCAGVPLANPSGGTRVYNLAGTTVSMSFTLESITDITPTCSGVAKPCNPPNSRVAGVKGVEEQVWVDTIDLNTSPFSVFKNDKWIGIEMSQCCRNGAITTGVTGNFFIDMKIYQNSLSSNSSIQFYEMPFHILERGMPFMRNYGGIDPDGDSIVFELTNPLSGRATPLTYSAPYSKIKPFTVYEPSGKPSPDPHNDPPIGFHLNSENGYLTFTPVKQGEVSVVAMTVKEYRNGALISELRRDMQFWVSAPSGNVLHKITAPDSICIVAGDTIDFNVFTSDPGDTLIAGAKDSLLLRYDNPISGTQFTIKDSNMQSGRFVWNTKASDARSQAYHITFFSQDNSCPIRVATQKTIRIFISDKSATPSTRINYTTDNDSSDFLVQSSHESDIVSYQWFIDNTKEGTDKRLRKLLGKGKTYDIEVHVKYELKNQCGRNVILIDTVQKKITTPSCKAKYIIAIDTNKSAKYRIYLINQSTTADSVKWYFSDGDSLGGSGVYRFQKYGKYEVCIKIWKDSCEDIFCDSIGMDSSGNIYKQQGFDIVLRQFNISTNDLQKEHELKVYPVPMDGALNIQSVDDSRLAHITLFDLRGVEVLSEEAQGRSAKVSTSMLSEGLYILQARFDDNTVVHRKIIKYHQF